MHFVYSQVSLSYTTVSSKSTGILGRVTTMVDEKLGQIYAKNDDEKKINK